jgi:hypothetical protein
MPSGIWRGKRSLAVKALAWAGLGTGTWLFYINICQLVFQCGCTFLWAGAAARCNIHHGPRHCPVCQLPPEQYYLLLGSIVVVQGVLLWRGQAWWAVLASPLLAVVQCLVLGWYRGYWS